MKLNSMDLSNHVALRKTYCPKVQVGPVMPSTILHELLQIRSVLTHASAMWETPVDLMPLTAQRHSYDLLNLLSIVKTIS